jgi:hypothetical protein
MAQALQAIGAAAQRMLELPAQERFLRACRLGRARPREHAAIFERREDGEAVLAQPERAAHEVGAGAAGLERLHGPEGRHVGPRFAALAFQGVLGAVAARRQFALRGFTR